MTRLARLKPAALSPAADAESVARNETTPLQSPFMVVLFWEHGYYQSLAPSCPVVCIRSISNYPSELGLLHSLYLDLYDSFPSALFLRSFDTWRLNLEAPSLRYADLL